MRPELELMIKIIAEERIATREEVDYLYGYCFGSFWALPSDEELANSKELRDEELSIIEESNRRGAGASNYYGFIISYIKKFNK